MKRRSFLKGLAAALVVPKMLITEKVEAIPSQLTEAERINKLYPLRVVKRGLPKVTWRKLHEGIDLNETNDILADLPWKKNNGGK